ncbi:MAG: RND family transporter [Halobacteriales archaeon]
MDLQPYVEPIVDLITSRTKTIIVLFLVLSVIFTAGLGNISTESGTEQFTTDLPSEKALQEINQEFTPRFTVDQTTNTGSTQLIQVSTNVLSKQSLLRMLELLYELDQNDDLRVVSTSSVAQIVATSIDPSAQTLRKQIYVIEQTPPSKIKSTLRSTNENFPLSGLLSNDYNEGSMTASSTIGVVVHSLPSSAQSAQQSSGTSGTDPLTDMQVSIQEVASIGGDVRVFGSGIFSSEFGNVIGDTMIIVTPAAVLFIILFLIYAYRDLVDLLLGVLSLFMAIIWTFGFMGIANIPFSQMLIAVPPILLALGVDFGIHAINRYREEKDDETSVNEAASRMLRQILIAFFIVTATTIIGFLSNLTSALAPIKDFGVVASIGIVFTFLIFGIFLPAAKIHLDQFRGQKQRPKKPLGVEGSFLGRSLKIGVWIAKKIPVIFLIFVIILSGFSLNYATGIDTTFTVENFLPPEKSASYLMVLPEPFKPSEYSSIGTLNYLTDNFGTSQGGSVTLFVEAPMRDDSALESIYKLSQNPPDTFATENRIAVSNSILTVIQDTAANSPEFATLVSKNDRNGNGVPDKNLDDIYDALFSSSSARGDALKYLSEDRRSTLIIYSLKAGANTGEAALDGKTLAEEQRYSAISTGETVVLEDVVELLLQSAIKSLLVALFLTAVFLVFLYWLLDRRPLLGLINVFPIIVTVALVGGSMRLAGLSFDAFTATVLALTVGLGVDYSVHIVHRFVDEYDSSNALFESLNRTLQGTGGALTGSMLTTVFGIGALYLAVFPAIGSFGLLTALSVLYAYLSSIIVLPPLLALWTKIA